MPTINNKFIKSLKINNVNDLMSFRIFCRNKLVEQANIEWRQNINNIVVQKLIENLKFDIQKGLKEIENRNTLRQFIQNAESANLTPGEFAVRNGLSEKDYEAQIQQISEVRVRLTYIFREYKTRNGIEISEKEYEERFNLYKNSQNYQKNMTYELFKINYLNDRILGFISQKIIENSKINDEKSKTKNNPKSKSKAKNSPKSKSKNKNKSKKH